MNKDIEKYLDKFVNDIDRFSKELFSNNKENKSLLNDVTNEINKGLIEIKPFAREFVNNLDIHEEANEEFTERIKKEVEVEIEKAQLEKIRKNKQRIIDELNLNKNMLNKDNFIQENSFVYYKRPKNLFCEAVFRPYPLKDVVKKVIFVNPKTIVLWKDGTKTIVTADGERFDKEKGLLMAYHKRFIGKTYMDDLVEVINNAEDVKAKKTKKEKKK